jgi:hypothetical protein
VEEPGVDEHLWISRYESLEEDIRTSPAESLSDLDELVAEMMEARGVPLAERNGEERSTSPRRSGSSRRRDASPGRSARAGSTTPAMSRTRSTPTGASTTIS